MVTWQSVFSFCCPVSCLHTRTQQRRDISRVTGESFGLHVSLCIYPAYLLAFLLFLPRVLMSRPSPIMVGTKLATATVTLTLLQGWTHLLEWNTPGWSLSDEAFFYLVFPFAILVLRRLEFRKLIATTFVLWVVDLIPPILLSVGFLNTSWLDTVRYNPLVRLPEFLAGVCLGRLFIIRKGELQYASYIGSLGVVGITLSLMISDRLPQHLLHSTTDYSRPCS